LIPRRAVESVSQETDWNAKIIDEFRHNQGRVGALRRPPGDLVHHHGRKSGRDYVSPMMYMADEEDAATIYVFASKGGSPSIRAGTTT